MKKITSFILPFLILVSCQSQGDHSGQKETDSLQASAEEGWQSLFNGEDLEGWRGFKNKPTDAWNVEEGTLHCDGNIKDAAHTDLISEGEYENFILSLQWKISPESNSGIMFHVTEDQESPSRSGPEYQIIDDEGWPGDLEPWQHTGCNYAMQVPDSGTVHINPVGEWNKSKIVVEGAHVEHWLNGEKILEYEMWSPEWKKRKAHGKWKEVASYGMAKKGHFALQYHGGDVWFKEIRIKAL